MKQMGFYYDPTVCIGCRACQVACKEEHKLPSGDFFRRAEAIETTTDGQNRWCFFSGACNHCTNAACIEACPTGAMYRAADGTVQHRDDLCIGCGRCQSSCPYGAVSLSSITGYAQKCDSCLSRRAAGRNPACVDACPVRALQFGPIDELKAKYGDHGAALPFLPDPAITAPNLLINGAAKAEVPASVSTEAQAPVPQTDSTAHIVILGSGAAAISAAKEIRSRSAKAKITMISREQRLPYSRPMLSKGLLGSFALDRYPIVDESWLAEHVDSICDTVTALDAEGHTVTLQGGRTIAFDKCIYALGMDCFVPPISGSGLPHVHTLRSDSDLHALRKTMLSARTAVVIGGGITGLELAWEMKKAGLAVVILDMVPQLLGRILDVHTAAGLQKTIEDTGITVVTGVQIAAIEGGSHAEAVRLQDGRTFEADLVVLSTGYRANTALAKAAGLQTERAVTVNARLQTSHPDIFACGDCASSSAATWLQSLLQGRIAGANTLGADLTYTPEAEPAILHTAGTSLLVVGDMGKAAEDDCRYHCGNIPTSHADFRVSADLPAEAAFTACLRNDRICGMALLGDISPMKLAEQAVAENWTLDQLCDALGQERSIHHEG